MAEREYIESAGMDGIVFEYQEQDKLAGALGSNVLDNYIPLPGLDLEEQLFLIDSEHDHDAYVEYFNRTGGRAHGWACTVCGKVIQWG